MAEESVIRLNMFGDWNAADLGELLTNLSYLYDVRHLLEDALYEGEEVEARYRGMRYPYFLRSVAWRGALPPLWDTTYVDLLNSRAQFPSRLRLVSVTFSSPGHTDLAGIGHIVGHLKDLIIYFFQRKDLARQRVLADEKAALEIDRMRIENAMKFVGLARKIGYTDQQIRQLMITVDGKQDVLVRLISEGRLTSLEDRTGPTT
jgi:hypothetical protein